MTRRILVTGANGHLGCSVLRTLVDRGFEVVPYVRASSDTQGIDGLGLAYFRGDILDGEALSKAASGCDAIINLAAVYRTYSRDPEEIIRPAVQGIENVLQAARANGVRRVVHTSSIAAVGFGWSADDVRDETHWNASPLNAYYQAKTESERRAWALAAELEVPMIAVNPASIAGPYDFRITPSSRYLLGLANGVGGTPLGGTNYVDVRDVAHVVVSALDRGKTGERYLVTGENITYDQLNALIVDLTGSTPARLSFPRWFVLAYGWSTERWARLRGREPSYSYDLLYETTGRYAWFDATKAQEAFDYQARDARAAVGATLLWLAGRGALETEVANRVRASIG
jgi:dihydroflavonol-4-reductase